MVCFMLNDTYIFGVIQVSCLANISLDTEEAQNVETVQEKYNITCLIFNLMGKLVNHGMAESTRAKTQFSL